MWQLSWGSNFGTSKRGWGRWPIDKSPKPQGFLQIQPQNSSISIGLNKCCKFLRQSYLIGQKNLLEFILCFLWKHIPSYFFSPLFQDFLMNSFTICFFQLEFWLKFCSKWIHLLILFLLYNSFYSMSIINNKFQIFRFGK